MGSVVVAGSESEPDVNSSYLVNVYRLIRTGRRVSTTHDDEGARTRVLLDRLFREFRHALVARGGDSRGGQRRRGDRAGEHCEGWEERGTAKSQSQSKKNLVIDRRHAFRSAKSRALLRLAMQHAAGGVEGRRSGIHFR